MKITICDICRAKNILGDGGWKISYKQNGKRIALDACEEHKDTFKVCKTYDEADRVYMDIVSQPKQKRIDLLFPKKKVVQK